ncbi:calcium-dependent protein kinase, putative [Entamoeba invadens IP1]|uniref:non-specific serine/threonine protein kinase n=1 Tax=Entamoeba invadens IP1 TaxID=370355 RepID=A0A0A1UHA4_ENTIV|nr:calcium-dependent protein kinase, putative [Entamoeba invadens IP1]ELP94977.1 calcium-dependent protein kinase, putative [Entamoeba invadens IP1]|eukprot:XP_004261748.1 calcium-dependent protein kinase, putative [Entamoeba invadens IP1]
MHRRQVTPEYKVESNFTRFKHLIDNGWTVDHKNAKRICITIPDSVGFLKLMEVNKTDDMKMKEIEQTASQIASLMKSQTSLKLTKKKVVLEQTKVQNSKPVWRPIKRGKTLEDLELDKHKISKNKLLSRSFVTLSAADREQLKNLKGEERTKQLLSFGKDKPKSPRAKSPRTAQSDDLEKLKAKCDKAQLHEIGSPIVEPQKDEKLQVEKHEEKMEVKKEEKSPVTPPKKKSTKKTKKEKNFKLSTLLNSNFSSRHTSDLVSEQQEEKPNNVVEPTQQQKKDVQLIKEVKFEVPKSPEHLGSPRSPKLSPSPEFDDSDEIVIKNSDSESAEKVPVDRPETPTIDKKDAIHIENPFVYARPCNIEEVYDMKEMVGRGGFSVVHRVVNRESGQEEALKVIEKDLIDDRVREALEREIGITRNLKHENVVQVFDVLEDEEYIYVAMEYITAGSLFARIMKKPLSEQEGQWVGYQLARTLYYLHSNGICHRDVKPENILISDEKELNIKLIDFGLAKNFRDEGLNTPCGTALYAAPEILMKKESYTCGVDIWCVGISVFVAMCGYQPFDGDNLEENLQQMRIGDVNFDEDEWGVISVVCKNFILGCLKMNCEKRLTAETMLIHPWLYGPTVYVNPYFQKLLASFV